MQATPLLDMAIVGGGVAGVIHLHYARQSGLDALLLEKQGGVGGLWRQLPPWQDIQISPTDWTLGNLPLSGPKQPHILANIEAWVERFGLADRIRLDTPVSRARYTGTCWELDTQQGTVRARHLVAATGGHNTPAIPDVLRRESAVRELHSSALRDPSELTGREVLVVAAAPRPSTCWTFALNTRRAGSSGRTGACAGSLRPASRRSSPEACGPTRRCR